MFVWSQSVHLFKDISLSESIGVRYEYNLSIFSYSNDLPQTTINRRWLFENGHDINSWNKSPTTKSVEDLFDEIRERRCAIYKEGIGSSCRVYRAVRVLKFLIQKTPLNDEIEDDELMILVESKRMLSSSLEPIRSHISTMSTKIGENEESLDIVKRAIRQELGTLLEEMCGNEVCKMNEFLDQLNSNQFKEIEKFFETMPKLTHTLKVKNPNTNVDNSIKLEGLSAFFA